MSTFVPISVVIAAHDEEPVLGRCLDALLDAARPDEIEIVVVCNGCTDRTAEVARGYGERVEVIETPRPSKTAALNLGDARATGYPRFYVDADVTLPLASVRRIADRLGEGNALAASPVMELDLRESSGAVRAYYRIWRRLPYVREGMIGVGVYALSEEGRGRFAAFPDVIADDGYVRMLFGTDERARVDDAPVRVYTPGRLADLVRIKTRSRLGRDQTPTAIPRSRRTRACNQVVSKRRHHDPPSALAVAGRGCLRRGRRPVAAPCTPTGGVPRGLRLGARRVVAQRRSTLTRNSGCVRLRSGPCWRSNLGPPLACETGEGKRQESSRP